MHDLFQDWVQLSVDRTALTDRVPHLFPANKKCFLDIRISIHCKLEEVEHLQPTLLYCNVLMLDSQFHSTYQKHSFSNPRHQKRCHALLPQALCLHDLCCLMLKVDMQPALLV